MRYLEFNPFPYNHTLTVPVAERACATQDYEADLVRVFMDSVEEITG